MLHNRQTSRDWQFTGWHMLIILVSFFTVVIGVNLTMAYLARSSWSGLVVPNSYVASQNFDKDLAIARRQHAMGWQSEGNLTRDVFRVTMKDSNGMPLTGLHISGIIERPVTESQDVRVELAERGDGVYEAAIAIAPGNWQGDITAEKSGGMAVRYVERFVVR